MLLSTIRTVKTWRNSLIFFFHFSVLPPDHPGDGPERCVQSVGRKRRRGGTERFPAFPERERTVKVVAVEVVSDHSYQIIIPIYIHHGLRFSRSVIWSGGWARSKARKKVQWRISVWGKLQSWIDKLGMRQEQMGRF